MDKNREYWNGEGTKKTFTHGLHADWIRDVDRESAVLDFGCGYGRLIPELQQLGFSRLYGFDSSEPMIVRAAQENPGACYTSQFEDLGDLSFALVTSFAVFTCCPTDEEQRNIVDLIDGVTEKGSKFYISDYEMADNPHYLERYQQKQSGTIGCFVSGGGTFRHHEPGHFKMLLQQWELLDERTVKGETLNGNDITIHQYQFVHI